MAPEVQHEKPLEDAMEKNLKVEIPSPVGKISKASSKVVNHPHTPAFTPSHGVVVGGANGDFVPDYFVPDMGYYPMNGYYGYCYPGYDWSSAGELEEQGYFGGLEGFYNQYPVVQGDDSQPFYYNSGDHLGYDAYGSCIPGTMIGMDVQCVARQPGFPGNILQRPLSPQLFSPSQVSCMTDIAPPCICDGSPLPVNATNGNRLGSGYTLPVSRSKLPPSMHAAAPAKAAAYTKFTESADKEKKNLSDAPSNQIIKSDDKVARRMSTLPPSAALAKVYIPIAKLPEKAGLLLTGATINAKGSGRGFYGPERLNERSKVNGLSNFGRLNEQNRGPRTTRQITPTSNGGDSTKLEGISKIISSFRKDQYNLPDFQTKYDHAYFFIIKSFTEDDVHKSIKYDVWSSTPNGNKKLDDAYESAQKKAVEKGSKCPVFLFFSVNASGQFCGVAEMTNRVDFDKNMDFWQQDKWTGFFPVKWHVIKDVPHTHFRHIRLENNDNKPVSNSRDTQEVKYLQGTEMLDIFKNFSEKTSILDDFGYYESRQKIMLDQKIRHFGAFSVNVQKCDDVLQVPEIVDVKIDPSRPADDVVPEMEDVEVNSEAKE